MAVAVRNHVLDDVPGISRHGRHCAGRTVTGSVKVALSITGILNILLLALDNFAPAQAGSGVA